MKDRFLFGGCLRRPDDPKRFDWGFVPNGVQQVREPGEEVKRVPRSLVELLEGDDGNVSVVDVRGFSFPDVSREDIEREARERFRKAREAGEI